MKSTPTPIPPIRPESGDLPIYRQIYERLRRGIQDGVLEPGSRIPSARALAKELGVARGTIEQAYSLLGAEGYVQSRGPGGTVVTPDLAILQPVTSRRRMERSTSIETPIAVPASAPDQSTDLPAAPTWMMQPESVLPLQMGLPALDAFPRKIWARLGTRALRAQLAGALAYPSPGGLPVLRQAIAAYLQMARGIDCRPEQVFVTSGLRNSLLLIRLALLDAGDRVWVEDPGYPPTRQLLRALGLQDVPVPVDTDGLMVAQAVAQTNTARAAVVTPAHHSPLSMSLSLPRRQALLEWAVRQQSWIVEDDYDGEYRYASRPLPALKSLDREGRVLYAGTFSKVLVPALRTAYLVVPEQQVARFEQTAHLCGGGVPHLTQETIAAFMAEGHFARHIQRMRKLYAERRAMAAAAFASVLSPHLHIEPQPGGMHLVLRTQAATAEGPPPDRQLADRMRHQGLYAQALSRWSDHPATPSALLVSFTNIATAEQALTLAQRIRELLQD